MSLNEVRENRLATELASCDALECRRGRKGRERDVDCRERDTLALIPIRGYYTLERRESQPVFERCADVLIERENERAYPPDREKIQNFFAFSNPRHFSTPPRLSSKA